MSVPSYKQTSIALQQEFCLEGDDVCTESKIETSRDSSEPDILSNFRNKIICGDVLKVMRTIPSGSVDLVVTSPPYNLKNSTGNGMKDGRGGKWKNAELIKGYSDYDDNMPHDLYAKWQSHTVNYRR